MFKNTYDWILATIDRTVKFNEYSTQKITNTKYAYEQKQKNKKTSNLAFALNVDTIDEDLLKNIENIKTKPDYKIGMKLRTRSDECVNKK